jgi:hypothetical protein
MNLRNIEPFPEVTSFLIFLGILLLGFKIDTNSALFKAFVRDVCKLMLDNYRDLNPDLLNPNSPFLKLIEQELKFLLKSPEDALLPATPVETNVLNVEDSFQELLEKLPKKGSVMSNNSEECKNFLNLIEDFKRDFESSLTHEIKDALYKIRRKITDYQKRTLKE